MSWANVLLWVNGVMFIGYGAACLLMPSLPADYAGFSLATSSGTVEVIAMYGGLQAGFGAVLIIGARDASIRGPILMALAVVAGSLGTARLLGMALHGASAYNLGAVAYELTTAALAFWATRVERGPAAA